MIFDREGFKNELLSKGVDWDDQQIDDYIALRKSGEKLRQEIVSTSPVASSASGNYLDSSREDPLTGLDMDRYGAIQQSDKNKMIDFAGNFLWEALDTTTFGALGALDSEDKMEDAITGGGPETFAGRVGAGLGGFAGFLVPFGATKALTTKAVQSGSKFGVQRVAKKAKEEASEFLSKEAGTKGIGYKKFNQLDQTGKDAFFHPLLGKSFNQTLNTGETSVAFTKRYNDSLDLAIRRQLKSIGISSDKFDDTVIKLRKIIDRTTSINGKEGGKHIAISNLQQRIALALGGTQGAGKLASVASHSLEEGLMFAAVETPMEFFQSQDENRDSDYVGRIGHAFVLGNALGLIRFTPGGMDWGKQGGIAKSAVKRIKDSFTKKRPYENMDLTLESQKEQLVTIVKSHWKDLGDDAATIFTAKAGNKIIATMDSIDDLAASPEGLKTIVKVLKGFDKDWSKQWGQEFFKMAGKDLAGSTPRMLMGSMAFNYEMVFDENIPLEDKIFHTALGAFMTKGGRKLSYTDSNGYTRVIEGTGSTQKVSAKLRLATQNLHALGMKPRDALLMQLYTDQALKQKWEKNLALEGRTASNI